MAKYMPARAPFDREAHKFERIATNVRKCDETMKKSIMHDRKAQQKLGRDVTKLLRDTINEEVEKREWGKGRQREEDRGTVSFTTHESSARIRWTGALVKEIEYGAGIGRTKGEGYPGVVVNYESDLDSRTAVTGTTEGNRSGYTNLAWYFNAPGQGNLKDKSSPFYNTITFGWEPMAPFYKTMLKLSSLNAKQLGLTNYQKAVREGVRIGADEIFNVPN